MFRLYPYQKKWIDDTSRLKICLKARQIGMSLALCFEALKMATEKKCNILILSTSERQSFEMMDKIYSLIKVFKQFSKLNLPRESRSELVLPNGSKIISLPAAPSTARGYAGHVFLDEFAFHRDAIAIWRAMLPTISRDYSLRIVSTPAGRSGMFYELWSDTNNGFTRHKIDIYSAMENGLKVDLDVIKNSMDSISFSQEFECEFIDESLSFFTLDLVHSAISFECEDWSGVVNGQMFLGIDVGRERDLTVITTVEKINDVFYVRDITPLLNTPFSEQRQEIDRTIRAFHPMRVCIDSTGIGMQLAEELQQRYGSLIEPVTFTSSIKENLATRTKILFEKRLIKIPNDSALVKDLYSVRKIVTPAGNVRYDADRDDTGHADRFWSLALALHAGLRPSGMPTIVTRRRLETITMLRGY